MISRRAWGLAVLSACAPQAAWAVPAPPAVEGGATAWLLISCALVLMMTLPGLTLFYGGLVRRKNVLSIAAQCLAAAAIGTLV